MEKKFEVILKKGITKDLKKLSKTDKIRIYKALEKLIDPFSLDIRKISGFKDVQAVRVGNYRIIFKIYFEKGVLFVIKIDKCERVYGRL